MNDTEDTMSTVTATATVTDLRAMFTGTTYTAPVTPVTLEGLLAEIEGLNRGGYVKVDVDKLRNEVEDVRASGDIEKLAELTERLGYFTRIGRTFKAYRTTAADWRPLMSSHGGYVVLGGLFEPDVAYLTLLHAGYTNVVGPDAAAKGDGGTCHLCGHRPVRYFFPLVCDDKRIVILSGCECIRMYVYAVIPSGDEAERIVKAMRSDEGRERAIVTANNKLDRLLASPSGWGVTYAEALAMARTSTFGAPALPGVTEGIANFAELAIGSIKTGKTFAATKVEKAITTIKAIGFDATWNRVARELRLRGRSASAPKPAAPAGFDTILPEVRSAAIRTEYRLGILEAKGAVDPDGRDGFWHRSSRAVFERWTMSSKWIKALDRALDKEEAHFPASTPPAVPTPVPAPASTPFAIPREGDAITATGTIESVIFIGHDRARYEHNRIEVREPSGVRIVFKDYDRKIDGSMMGRSLTVAGKVGWIESTTVYLSGRKTLSIR